MTTKTKLTNRALCASARKIIYANGMSICSSYSELRRNGTRRIKFLLGNANGLFREGTNRAATLDALNMLVQSPSYVQLRPGTTGYDSVCLYLKKV